MVTLSAKPDTANIVSFPPVVTIGAGQSSAGFDVTANQGTSSTEELLILASYAARSLGAKLTVVAG